MSNWTELAPFGGWTTFDRSEELTAGLWALASNEQWHYLNLTTTSAIWESRHDATSVVVHYDGEGRIVLLSVEAGDASKCIASLVAQFSLFAAPGRTNEAAG